MENSLSTRLRPRGTRSAQNTGDSHPPNVDNSVAETRPSRNSPTDPFDPTSPSSSPPSSSSSTTLRPTRSGATALDSRAQRRCHPYQRQTRSTTHLTSQSPPDATPSPTESASPSPTPGATSRRAARRNLDAASQQRLFLRRNLISSPRLGGDELAVAAVAAVNNHAPAPPTVPPDLDASSPNSRRNNRGGAGTRGRGHGANGSGNPRAPGRIDSLRDRFNSTEARSRSSSASSIIRARLTARISFGQRAAQTPAASAAAPSHGAHGAAAAAVPASDRLTRNGARRAAEAIVDQAMSGIPGLVDEGEAESLVGRPEIGVEVESRGRAVAASPNHLLTGPGWSGTYDRTHGDEITGESER